MVRWIITVVLTLLALWIFYPALSLPPSLIDDFVLLQNYERWVQHMGAGNYVTAIREDIGSQQRVFNLGFMVSNTISYRLSGGQPFHWLRLVCLLVVCVATWRISVGRAGQCLSGLCGAGLAVALFVTGEVPGSVDFQSLRGNWIRLFTTDASVLVVLSLYLLSLLAMVRRAEDGRRWWPQWLCAALLGCVVFMFKLPFFGVVLAASLAALVPAALLRRKKLSLALLGASLFTAAAFAAYNAVMRSLVPPVEGRTYGSEVTFTFAHMMSGWKYYIGLYWDMLGPMFPALLAAAAILAVQLVRRRHTHFVPLLTLLVITAVTVASIGIYTPWNYQVPRYALVGFWGLCLLAGFCFPYAARALRVITKTRPAWLALALVGLALPLLPMWVFLAALLVLVAVGVTSRFRMALPVITGVMLSGALYLAFITPLSRAATNNALISREFANWNATLEMLKHSARQQKVCFAGDVYDEQVGSMGGFIRRWGIEPQIFATTDAAHCTSASLILVHGILTPVDQRERYKALPLEKSFDLRHPSYRVPVSFWVFRDRLLKRPDGLPAFTHDTWSMDYVWRLYRQG